MRRTIWTTILILTIIMVFSFVFAESNVDINVNGSLMEVPKVAVVMDGKSTDSTFSSFIMGDRTLVPVRFVAESFGAKVDWNSTTKTATINHQGKTLDLTIDSKIIMVDGKPVTIEDNSTPKLVVYTALNEAKTMVPVRFISEVMGYEVGWDASSYTALINTPVKPDEETGEEVLISGINTEKGWTGNHRIKIQTDGEFEYSSEFIPTSNKLIIDIKNAKLDIRGNGDKPGDMLVEDQLITRLQYSQFTIGPYTTRIVLTLDEKADFKIIQDKGEAFILFNNEELNEPYTPEEEQQEPEKEPEKEPEIRPDEEDEDEDKEEKDEYTGPSMIRQEVVNGKNAIVVYFVDNPNYNVIQLSDPERIVVDIMDTKIVGELYQEYGYQTGFIKGVRASQYTGDKNYKPGTDVVRVVLDVRDGAREHGIIVLPERDRLVIFPEEDAWDAFQYKNMGTEGTFNFTNQYPTEYKVDYDSLRKEIIIKMPLNSTNLPDGKLEIGDKLVRTVLVERGIRETTITIQFRRGVIHNVLSRPGDEVFSIHAIRNENVRPQDITIVVDPGHGGKAPGAVKGNYKEKDINLQGSLKLRDALRAAGYNVVMTRESDIEVNLHERARIANNLNADLFISMHANATMSSSVNGLEILYCPASNGSKKIDDQFPFAKFAYDEILKQTGSTGRSIIKRPDLVVVRETQMPAILVETGYMTNPHELSLVLSDSYQNQVVNGIVNAVKIYFDEY